MQQLNYRLLNACRTGNVEQVNRCLISGANVNFTASSDGSKTLIVAAKNDHLTIVEMLTDRNADVRARDDEGFSALFHAVLEENQVNIVRCLLDHGASANEYVNDMTRSPFSLMCQNGNIGLGLLIVCHGITCRDSRAYMDMVQLLYEEYRDNVEVDATDVNGQTALTVPQLQQNLKLSNFWSTYGTRTCIWRTARAVLRWTVPLLAIPLLTRRSSTFWRTFSRIFCEKFRAVLVQCRLGV
ncbi:hypothetical protein niasHT_018491 [Heterodera trifolii]|uniref:ANK_REP_REGION domain-containing protein n=1 Tax=Heterodera trifolii TaxID=157864 RepID=A0ABD2KUW8_9BILA